MATLEGLVEKKAFMSYGRKWFTLRGNRMTFADVERGEAKGEMVIQSVSRLAETGGDTYGINIVGNGGEAWAFRTLDRDSFLLWYNAIYHALAQLALVPPRNNGLPPTDPRTGLAFVDIPPEYLYKFSFLDAAVLHWFSAVKKVGTKGTLTAKKGVEERVLVMSDKYIYLCKPSGEITRCLKVVDVEKIWCNYRKVEPGKEVTVGLKVRAPDYDIVLSSLDIVGFLKAFCCAYKYLTKGSDCPIAEASFEGILHECNLTRPENWEFILVLPTSKAQLRKAFDVFAQKTGVQLIATTTTDPSGVAAPPSGGAAASAAAPGGSAVPSAVHRAAETEPSSEKDPGIVPRSDPMGYFLIKLSLEKYYTVLKKQKVDLDVLEYMDETDLTHFGVTDSTHRKRILDSFAKPSFMEELHEEIAHANERANPTEEIAAPVRKVAESNASASAAPAAPVVEAPKPPAPKPAISLDDDDDFDLAPPPKPPAADIAFDDDDFDIPLPAKPATQPAISLDDDDI